MAVAVERGEVVELDRGECLRLLGAAVIGRVVFTKAALPAAQPVTYLLDRHLDHDEIIFRVAGGSTLAATTRHAVLAFEVDEMTGPACTGWSVLGVGQAYEVTDLGRLSDLDRRPSVPWILAGIADTVALPLQRLSGRRLRLIGDHADAPGRAASRCR